MSVEINLPPILQSLTGGAPKIEVTGATVGECFHALVSKYPALKTKLFDKNNKVPNGVNIFVNGATAYPDPLTKPVCDGDKIFVSYIVLGG